MRRLLEDWIIPLGMLAAFVWLVVYILNYGLK